MFSAPAWQDDEAPFSSAASSFSHLHPPRPLPPAVVSAVWRGSDLGTAVSAVVASGWVELDHELPGGGWPCGSLTEVLSPQTSLLEWRLLGPALRRVVADGGQVLLVAPPKPPFVPGLQHLGLGARHLVWVQADAPSERLWVTEQLIKAHSPGAILTWLPQARPEQLRRLQAHAQGSQSLVMLFRPDFAQHEASPAPLRVQASAVPDWALRVQVLKRRGPAHETPLLLPSVPGGLQAVLTPRVQTPGLLVSGVPSTPQGAAHAVGRTPTVRPSRHHTTTP